MPQTNEQKAAAAEDKAAAKLETASYVVTAAGAAYTAPGDSSNIQLGLQNRVIELDDDEAMRLLLLGAVRVADDADVEAEQLRSARQAELDAQLAGGPAGNPYGGTIVGDTTLQEHAAAQIAEARKAAAKRS